jgi:hypothetical protein
MAATIEPIWLFAGEYHKVMQGGVPSSARALPADEGATGEGAM